MTNDATRARAQSMPDMNRRTALAVTGSALAASLASKSRAAQAAPADASLAELEHLIAAQAEAYQISIAKWDAAAAIEDGPAMQAAPERRIQVGRLLGPRDDDGNDTWTPIYVYSNEGIEKHLNQHLDAMLSMWGHGPNGEERKQQIRDRYAQKISQKKAELAAIEADVARIEAECGYAAAEKAAAAASEAIDAIEETIVAFVPGSLAAAARKAEWVVAAYRGEEVQSYLCREQVLEALTAIGKAVAL